MSCRAKNYTLLHCAILFLLSAAEIPAQTRISESTTESRLKERAKSHPTSFETNYQLAEYYFHSGKLLDGIPYMEKAQSLDPTNYVSGYDLALAYFETHEYAKSRRQIEAMLPRHDTAELHSLLADAEESAGDYVRAAQEYQRAARMDPTEARIFDWGTELIAHSAPEAAIEVFSRGLGLHPKSAKLNLGLGIALFSHHDYESAIRALCAATDLEPSESWPYIFLGKLYNISSSSADEVRKRLARFVQLQPDNARAHYYYALSLWNREGSANANLTQVESLLKKSTALDGRFPDAHLQLGILYADEHKYTQAIQELKKTIVLQPSSTAAHYHLAQAFVRTGQKVQAHHQFQTFERLRKQEEVQTEKDRKDLKQLIVTMREQAPTGSATEPRR